MNKNFLKGFQIQKLWVSCLSATIIPKGREEQVKMKQKKSIFTFWLQKSVKLVIWHQFI